MYAYTKLHPFTQSSTHLPKAPPIYPKLRPFTQSSARLPKFQPFIQSSAFTTNHKILSIFVYKYFSTFEMKQN